MTGRPTFCIAIALALASSLTACGAADGDLDRHQVESRTCAVLRERGGRAPFEVPPERFAETLRRYRDSDRPYSTLEPFLRACRSAG